MSNGRDSDRPGKNGKDQLQDREIRDLKDAVDHIEDILSEKTEKFTRAITNLERTNESTHREIQGDIKTGAALAKLLWGLAFLFLTSLGGLLGYGFSEISRLDDEIQRVDARTAADWAKGRQWGESLDKDVARLLKDIRVVRERIEHHNHRNGTQPHYYRTHDFTEEKDLGMEEKEEE